MSKKNLSKLAIAVSVLLGSCASIVGGSSFLEMETNPENINVTLQGVQKANLKRSLVTPFKVELDKSTDYRVFVNTPN